MRIGQGLDVHPFSDDTSRPLLLGGVAIPGGPGLEGHSDADVVLHALVDALAGAAGLGDIGTLFGAEDPVHVGAASSVFLDGVLGQVAARGWAVANVDCTIVAERPRIGPHREAIAASVARLLDVPADRVNVKATTTDGLGFTGRGQGIACLAVALLLPASAA
ncbi:MAG: 2-C-methyl-D-erythritol 2,4-cyclodiphosphate synthase [Euzebyales bacterium]|jgi:2-C-methyl-D-erythritol 2,4-cyclodiphosphate synthase|nr:2-C-methyl-D-erythritol 2,4-cyclodiphosphate synthase [Euzebyales bacterium]